MTPLPRLVGVCEGIATVEMDYRTLADIAGSLADAAYLRREVGLVESHPGVSETRLRADAFDQLCDEFRAATNT